MPEPDLQACPPDENGCLSSAKLGFAGLVVLLRRGGGAAPGSGLGQGGGEGSPFGALGVQRRLGALGAGNGGGGEFAGGFLPGLAGSLDRAGLPFGLLAGGSQVRGGALRFAGCAVALADGGVTRGGGPRGLAFCGFGAGLGCGEPGGGVC